VASHDNSHKTKSTANDTLISEDKFKENSNSTNGLNGLSFNLDSIDQNTLTLAISKQSKDQQL
jgi:hypothetical protein